MIVKLLTNDSTNIFSIEQEVPVTFDLPLNNLVSQQVIDLLNNKTLEFVSYFNNTDADKCVSDCHFINVSEEFAVQISFNYDENEDILFAESVNETPCGNTFCWF